MRLFFTLLVMVSLTVAMSQYFDVGKQLEAKEMAKKIRVFNAEISTYEEVDVVIKDEKQWKNELTPEQFRILRKQGTEPATSSSLNQNKKTGIYECAACGNDLFTSDAKFDSGTGWPSFFQPVAKENVGAHEDNSFFMKRVEVHCARCGGHLGHIFPDGPPPTGQRYCINGESLRFIEANK